MYPPALTISRSFLHWAAVLAALLAISTNGAIAEGPVFSVSSFGAIPDDGIDDRAAIQATLDAAGAYQGTAELGLGTYDVIIAPSIGRNSTGGTSGTAAYHGLVVPPGTTLGGIARDGSILKFNPGTANPLAVGNCIVNGNYNTAAVNYGAGSGYVMKNFTANVTDITNGAVGNIIGLCHASGATIQNVFLGACRYHAIEINRSKNILVEDAECRGVHPESSTLQLDIGSMGSKSFIPTTTVLESLTFRRCQFAGRGEETAGGKVVELGHTNSTCIIRDIVFEDCYFESMKGPSSVCVSVDNPPAQELSGLRFERCRFFGIHDAPGFNALLNLPVQGTQLLQNLTVKDCTFEGYYWQGIVVVSASPSFNTGHDYRRGIRIEGNRFAPILDRAAPVSGGAIRSIAVAACRDAVIRGNLIETPATAQNLSLSAGMYGMYVSNCRNAIVEENIFTYAHASKATAPVRQSAHIALYSAATPLEQTGSASTLRITGNMFLYPSEGIWASIYAATAVPTTQWAPGGPWVNGLMAGNFSSGATASASSWVIQHDLSETGDIGRIADSVPARSKGMGWYPCNGAALTTLDSGYNQLARYNANQSGLATNLPNLPGKVIRLHGPLTGEGLLSSALQSYSGSQYRGTVQAFEDLNLLPAAGPQPEIWVVRSPLGVFRRPANAPGAPFAGQYFSPLNNGVPLMEPDADLDADGRPNILECALLTDPSVQDSSEGFSAPVITEGSFSVRLRCSSRRSSPPIRLQSSADMITWRDEGLSLEGQAFQSVQGTQITQAPYNAGREVTIATPGATGRSWRATAGSSSVVLWQGFLNVAREGAGDYTFGATGTGGTMIYLDKNADGDFSDAGELALNTNDAAAPQTQTATVNLTQSWVPVAVVYYDNGTGNGIRAWFKKGADFAFDALDQIGSTTESFAATAPDSILPSLDISASTTAIFKGQSCTLTWSAGNATAVTIDNGIGAIAASGTRNVAPAATTTWTITASNAFGSVSRTVSVTVAPGGNYRYYRLVPTALREEASADSVQLSEFQLLLNGVRLAGASASAPGGTGIEGEGPSLAADENLTTSWRDAGKTTPLVLDFGTPTGANGYRIATGSTTSDRDPVSWRLEGSLDAITWTVLDAQFNQPATDTRETYSPSYSFSVTPAEAPFQITAAILNPAKTHMAVTWQSEAGFTYKILRSTTMQEGSWTDVVTGLSAAGATTTAAVPLGDGTRAFFKVIRE